MLHLCYIDGKNFWAQTHIRLGLGPKTTIKLRKNIASAEVLKLADQVQYAAGQVVSKTLVQNKGVGITLFAFAKGEGTSEHESTGDAFVTCLDGKGKIMIDGKPYFLEKGESIVMPANHPHAVYGEEDFKMMLVVVFPPM